MKDLDFQSYFIILIISNTIATLQLIAAIKHPKISRISFFLLFAWACWINWKTSLYMPQVYLEYADLTWLDLYKDIIKNWFAQNIRLSVGFIAISQGLIAISMLLKGWIFKLGCIGGIIFLVAIIPLGFGSAFPSTAIMAIALAILLQNEWRFFVWESFKAFRV